MAARREAALRMLRLNTEERFWRKMFLILAHTDKINVNFFDMLFIIILVHISY